MKLKYTLKGSALAATMVLAAGIFAQGNPPQSYSPPIQGQGYRQNSYNQGGQGIIVNLNGQPVSFSNGGPMMVNDHVMVPLRGVLEQMGANVQWHQETQSVTISNGQTKVRLHIGDPNADVNGQTVALDQPAIEMDGTTLVPLRFLSENFGADVHWDAANRAVDISTGNAMNVQTVTTTANLQAQTSMPPLVLKDSAQGWIPNGQAVQFTMTGAPGGQAFLEIPGIAADIPMQEISPGQYQASWTPNGQVNVLAATAMGKLVIGSNTYYSTPINNLNVDMNPPRIDTVFPKPNAVISGFQPEVRVDFMDLGSGIDPSTVRLQFNGQDVTAQAHVTDHDVEYRLPNNIAPGQYSVAFTVADKAGVPVTKSWNFSVIGNSVSSNFTHTGRGTIRPGETISFSLQAPPGSQAVVDLPSGETVSLAKTSPGMFTGTYVVKHFDRFGGNMVDATITAPNGEVYTIQSPQPMGVSGDLSPREFMPVISSPLPSNALSNPLVVAGSAPPGSMVVVHVDYRSDVGPHATVHGDLADLEIPVDTGGNFQSKPIHLDLFQPGWHTVYHVTAKTVLPDGTQSDAAELSVHQ